MKREFLLKGLSAFLGVVCSASLASGEDTPAGWSVEVKPKRAVMSYAPEANGPRLLIIACMRDTEEFGMYSTGLMAGAKPHGGILTMQLVNSGMKYTVRGEPGIDSASNQPAFSYETNIDSKALGMIRAELMPLLQAKGPIVVTIGQQERKVPVAGMAEPLKKFSAVCFGGR